MSTATMTTLARVEARAAERFAEYGLASTWTFGWDRAVRRRGLCNHTDRHITMSRKLAEMATFEESEQTLLHEVAHALVGGGHGHDSVWLAQARAMGYKGHRTSTRQNEVKPPLTGRCPNGHESGRFRKPKQPVSCGRCSRKFDARYLITWTRTA
jgi:hypothetical protein